MAITTQQHVLSDDILARCAERAPIYDRENRFVVEPGTVDVMVGSSSQDIHCIGSFEITGESADISGKKVFFSETRATLA